MSPTACRLVVYLCVAAAFCLIVTQPALSLVLAFLIPFWFFIANVVATPVVPVRRVRKTFSLTALPVFSPRPPPVN